MQFMADGTPFPFFQLLMLFQHIKTRKGGQVICCRRFVFVCAYRNKEADVTGAQRIDGVLRSSQVRQRISGSLSSTFSTSFSHQGCLFPIELGTPSGSEGGITSQPIHFQMRLRVSYSGGTLWDRVNISSTVNNNE